jgi:hypothetical protein
MPRRIFLYEAIPRGNYLTATGTMPSLVLLKNFLQEKAVEATKQEKERKEEKT